MSTSHTARIGTAQRRRRPCDRITRSTAGRHGHLLAIAVGLLAACGAGEHQDPGTGELVIEKDSTAGGDKQVGVAGELLAQDFRARVTRDGEPVEGVTVYWTTMQGTMSPVTVPTDADGISASRWTTKFLYTEQEAYASLDPVLGPRVPGSVLPGMVKFTAIATPDPAAANTVHVLSDGGNRFEPASITVFVGDTVNWLWPVGSASHNIVPDDGNQPSTSGAPTGFPKFLSFRFATPGVYPYHCTVHGGPGGVGMSGSVTVQPRPVTN
ncbi:MAG: plastocyanin/azurin family copper-binding protein [Gemmatimonadales bacterium]